MGCHPSRPQHLHGRPAHGRTGFMGERPTRRVGGTRGPRVPEPGPTPVHRPEDRRAAVGE